MNLFIDIETIPDQREGALENAAELVKVPANYKKPEAIEKYRTEHAEEEYRKTALKGIAGEICSIAWAVNNSEPTSIVRQHAVTEKDLLSTFFARIATYGNPAEGDFQRITWIGHNVIDFDLRFIKQRALVNNTPPTVLIPADSRHGTQNVFDTMKEWAGWKGFVSLDALCSVFGFEGKGDIDGSMVWDLWQAQDYETIRRYNEDDIERVRNVYNRMVWAA